MRCGCGVGVLPELVSPVRNGSTVNTKPPLPSHRVYVRDVAQVLGVCAPCCCSKRGAGWRYSGGLACVEGGVGWGEVR